MSRKTNLLRRRVEIAEAATRAVQRRYELMYENLFSQQFDVTIQLTDKTTVNAHNCRLVSVLESGETVTVNLCAFPDIEPLTF